SFAVLSDEFIEIKPSQLVAAGIIVLLAGLTLVGAIEDAITGFPVTSAGRGVETMIITGGILGGITLALELFDRLGTSPPAIDPSITGQAPGHIAVLAAGVGAAGFAVASYATVRATIVGACVGSTGMLIYLGVNYFDLGVVVGSAFAACAMGLIGGILARIATVPPLVVTLAGITPFLPGLSVYRGLAALTSDQTGVGLGLLFQALAIAVALAAGIVFGEWVTRNLRRPAAAELGRRIAPDDARPSGRAVPHRPPEDSHGHRHEQRARALRRHRACRRRDRPPGAAHRGVLLGRCGRVPHAPRHAGDRARDPGPGRRRVSPVPRPEGVVYGDDGTQRARTSGRRGRLRRRGQPCSRRPRPRSRRHRALEGQPGRPGHSTGIHAPRQPRGLGGLAGGRRRLPRALRRRRDPPPLGGPVRRGRRTLLRGLLQRHPVAALPRRGGTSRVPPRVVERVLRYQPSVRRGHSS